MTTEKKGLNITITFDHEDLRQIVNDLYEQVEGNYVRHTLAEWEVEHALDSYQNDRFKCTYCHFLFNQMSDYCPHCGSQMKTWTI